MKLTIVTHTAGTRPDLLERCKASVAAHLPADSEHVIIPLTDMTKFAQARVDALKLGDLVCFVDDDDEVANDSLRLCKEALEKTDAGIAFTDEQIVDQNGKELMRRDGRRAYTMLFSTPFMFHHLVMYNTKHVPEVDLKALPTHVGTEYLMTASAGLTAGAVHVPVLGYRWYRHQNVLTKPSDTMKPAVDALAKYRTNSRRGLIPLA